MVFAFSAVFVFSGFLLVNSDIYFKISKSIDIFGKIYREVSINYVDELDPENFMVAGIKGMLNSLDPYTVYIDETMKKDFDVVTSGKYGGIGTSVGLRRNKITILDLMEGYPAQRQGLRVGDVILKVDSIDVNKSNYNKLSSYLKGEPGKTVTLTIEREGVDDNLIFTLQLEEIVIKNVTYFGFLPEESNIAYIKLSGFSRSAGNEVKNALLDLKSQKLISSIVLDLRGNPGGLLDQAIDVAEKFLNKSDLIVSVIGRDTTKIMKYYSEETPIADKTPLVVLVDGGSASASEIVAGAIKDHDRGVIVGETTFGKGLVQTVLPLSFNTSLKLTTAKYYTPSGRCIQEIDYSNNNEIYVVNKSKDRINFYTDNKREVFPNGGIKPDSVVSNISHSKQVQSLLARGMFFKFTTKYFNTHSISDVQSINEEVLFTEFIKYLEEHKFEYNSKSEKLLDELEKIAQNEEMNENILSDLDNLKKRYLLEKSEELHKHKSEIISNIVEELAARINGRQGRIIQATKNDKQYKIAIEILNNKNIYDQLLGVHN